MRDESSSGWTIATNIIVNACVLQLICGDCFKVKIFFHRYENFSWFIFLLLDGNIVIKRFVLWYRLGFHSALKSDQGDQLLLYCALVCIKLIAFEHAAKTWPRILAADKCEYGVDDDSYAVTFSKERKSCAITKQYRLALTHRKLPLFCLLSIIFRRRIARFSFFLVKAISAR